MIKTKEPLFCPFCKQDLKEILPIGFISQYDWYCPNCNKVISIFDKVFMKK